MTDRYLVALDILATHGGTRTAAWDVAGELLAQAPLDEVFVLVATAETDERLTAVQRAM